MSRCWVCDGCQTVLDEYPPLELSEDTGEVDDDGDVIAREHHFCALRCLTSWAMARELDRVPL